MFGPSGGARSSDRTLHIEWSWVRCPLPLQDWVCARGRRQKMDSLISVAVHADERDLGKSISPGEEREGHTNARRSPGEEDR